MTVQGVINASYRPLSTSFREDDNVSQNNDERDAIKTTPQPSRHAATPKDNKRGEVNKGNMSSNTISRLVEEIGRIKTRFSAHKNFMMSGICNLKPNSKLNSDFNSNSDNTFPNEHLIRNLCEKIRFFKEENQNKPLIVKMLLENLEKYVDKPEIKRLSM